MTVDFRTVQIGKVKAPETEGSLAERSPGAYLTMVLTAVVIGLSLVSLIWS